jgi:hypothetical protein
MNHFVINGHGVNLSNLVVVPANTCIITVTRSGVSLKELERKLWIVSESIVSAGVPEELFEDGNTTKRITKRGKDFEEYLKNTTDGPGDSDIIFRNHLQGDVLPDMLIDLDAGHDKIQQQFFGIFKIVDKKKSLDTKKVSFKLSEYCDKNGPGVYIFFVCRVDQLMNSFKELVKEPRWKGAINDYLSKKGTEEELDINRFRLPKFIPMIKHLGEIGIRDADEGLAYYESNPPPHLTMSREHSDITDKNEAVLEPLQPYIDIQRRKIREIDVELKELEEDDEPDAKYKQLAAKRIKELKKERAELIDSIEDKTYNIRLNTHQYGIPTSEIKVQDVEGGTRKGKRRKCKTRNKYKRR